MSSSRSYVVTYSICSSIHPFINKEFVFSLKVFHGVSEKSVKGVSRNFKVSFKEVSIMSQRDFKDVANMFLQSVKGG